MKEKWRKEKRGSDDGDIRGIRNEEEKCICKKKVMIKKTKEEKKGRFEDGAGGIQNEEGKCV